MAELAPQPSLHLPSLLSSPSLRDIPWAGPLISLALPFTRSSPPFHSFKAGLSPPLTSVLPLPPLPSSPSFHDDSHHLPYRRRARPAFSPPGGAHPVFFLQLQGSRYCVLPAWDDRSPGRGRGRHPRAPGSRDLQRERESLISRESTSSLPLATE